MQYFNADLNITTKFNSRMFSPFIKTAALKIKSYIVKKAKQKAVGLNTNSTQKTRFIVIHLRGRDRKCTLSKYKGDQLINKVESFGVFKNNSFIYLMTDLTRTNTHVKSLKRKFGDQIFYKWDIKLFEQKGFKNLGTYLIYATELELQAISDGIVRTYKGHGSTTEKKELGFLQPPECAWKPKRPRHH